MRKLMILMATLLLVSTCTPAYASDNWPEAAHLLAKERRAKIKARLLEIRREFERGDVYREFREEQDRRAGVVEEIIIILAKRPKGENDDSQ